MAARKFLHSITILGTAPGGRIGSLSFDELDGTDLTDVPAAALTGTVADARLSANVPILVGGFIPTAYLPSLAITDVFPVADAAARVALAAERGDIAIQADNGITYALSTDDPTTDADWLAISAPGGSVTSVNGQTGVVVLDAGDVGAEPADATLTALAGTAVAADKGIYATGVDAFTTYDLTSYGRTLAGLADAAAARASLGLGAVAVLAKVGTATIDDDSVTYAKMQNVSATSRVLGRRTAGAGDPEECTLTQVLDFIGGATKGDLLVRDTASWARVAAGAGGCFLEANGAGNMIGWSAFTGKIHPTALSTSWSDVTAYMSTNQALTTGAYNDIVLDVELADSLNEFGSSVFTPNSTGVYLINFGALCSGGVGRIVCVVRTGATVVSIIADGQLVFAGSTAIVPLTGGTAYKFSIFPVPAGVTALAGLSQTYVKIRRLS